MKIFKQEEQKRTYTLKMYCHNCGWEGSKEIPKGTPRANTNAFCPRCECPTLGPR
jgi:hypothetical protein